MLSYCLNCRKHTRSKNPKFVKTKNGRIMLLSNCAACDLKKSTFIKKQETSGLLNSLGITTPLTLFRIGLFGGCSQIVRESEKSHLSKMKVNYNYQN